MERASEFTERRLGQLHASIKFRQDAMADLKHKRADLAAVCQRQDAKVKKLSVLRDELERENRALQDANMVGASGAFGRR